LKDSKGPSPERVYGLSVLLDAYEPLLPPRQREVMRLRLDEDLSLSEIAENVGISRQAAEDAVKRCERSLLAMERKLGMVQKTARYEERLERIGEAARAMTEANWREKREEVLLLARGTEQDGGEMGHGV